MPHGNVYFVMFCGSPEMHGKLYCHEWKSRPAATWPACVLAQHFNMPPARDDKPSLQLFATIGKQLNIYKRKCCQILKTRNEPYEEVGLSCTSKFHKGNSGLVFSDELEANKSETERRIQEKWQCLLFLTLSDTKRVEAVIAILYWKWKYFWSKKAGKMDTVFKFIETCGI